MASSPWAITRQDHEVRIDLTEAAILGERETQAIVDAVQRHLAKDGVTTIRLDGPVLDVLPVPDGFAGLVARLAVYAEGQGIRFHVGPL